MNKEEKEAIDKLKSVINNDTGVISDDIQDDEIETILGLINKQQKEIKARLEEIDSLYKMMSIKDDEIEKLKSKKYILNAETNEIKEIPISDDYISKDKIRKLKEHIHKTLDNNGITRGHQLTIDNYFKELLGGEND